MKKVIMPLAGVIALLSVVSCNQSATTDTAVDSTTTTTTNASTPASTDASMPAGSTATVDENTSYVDLTTGKTVKVKKNQQTGKYTNSETNEPIWYYINPTTADTFDIEGRVVNNALVKGPEGKYTVDETRLSSDNGKVKIQGDGDLKAKEGDVKAKIETDGDMKLKSGDSKEKIKDDKYKSKDASGKTKVTEEGTKTKSNQ